MRPGLPTDLGRWRRIAAILDLALELPSEERSAVLDETCSGDAELRAEVEAFLAADVEAGAFLAAPVGEYAPELLAEAAAEEQGETNLAGHRVGRYQLLREIGSGGMGTVYEAEDTQLGRRVAVKLLPPEYSRDPSAKARFLREARAAAALDHPNICTVHDFGDAEGQLYIVMACYEGETLKARLERGPLPVDEARQVAIQVARGLAHAHEAGIVHRDIKSANVLLTRRGEAKILDFGIAKTRTDTSLTRTGGSPGTPAYMSPEQAQGKPVDVRTDLWSLGVLLYEMLAGRRPFAGSDEQAVLYAIQSRDPEPLGRVRPEVPRVLDGVVAKALAKNPDERYQSAAELLDDLETGRTPESLRGGWRAPRPAAWLWGFAGVAVLALVAFAVWWVFLRIPTIRVAILVPTVTASASDPEFRSVAADVVEAAAGALASLQGVQPLDPPDRYEKSGSKAEQLRTAEADEVLRPILDCERDRCWVTLRRLSGPRRLVKKTVSPFDVQVGIENAHGLAERVGTYIQHLYSDHPSREGLPGSNVRPEDYAAFVALERRSDRGERLGSRDLDRLVRLLQTSPRLLGAHLLAAGVARREKRWGQAMIFAEKAHQLSPFDPRSLFEQARIEIASHRRKEAQATVNRLAELAPGDIRVEMAQAELLAEQGRLEEAQQLWQKIVLRRPTWRTILELASLEVRMDDRETGRRRLRDLLQEQPENSFVLEILAAWEVQFGDLQEAAKLYEQLIALRPEAFFLSNLGSVRYILANYPAAAEAYRRAADLEADNELKLQARFNFANTRQAQGALAEAMDLYRTLERDFAAASGQPDEWTRMFHAKCLARLGRDGEADRLVRQVLKPVPDDAQILHIAAQVFAIIGDRYSAFNYIQETLRKGLRREWFTMPEFDSLRGDPGFQSLLDSYTPASRKPGPPDPSFRPHRSHFTVLTAAQRKP